MNTHYAVVQHPNRGILFGPYAARWEVEEEVSEYLSAYALAHLRDFTKPTVTFFEAEFVVVGRHGQDWYHSEIVQR